MSPSTQTHKQRHAQLTRIAHCCTHADIDRSAAADDDDDDDDLTSLGLWADRNCVMTFTSSSSSSLTARQMSGEQK